MTNEGMLRGQVEQDVVAGFEKGEAGTIAGLIFG